MSQGLDVPDRWFVALRGRSSSDHALDPITLIVTERQDTAGLQLEEARIIALCDRPLSVAEIARYLHVPLGVAKVLLSRLLDEGRVHARPPAASASTDTGMLERVLCGLRNL
ncbi:DUF742 domain-containing protein [Streptomyces chrestomyceticus]|uniref:DUF742 domain-containing protein n=1 Tax=Streptomyces chrestomyceticus TaxID=68185 RepID=UPI0036CB0D48